MINNNALTVSDLIKQLKQFNPKARVFAPMDEEGNAYNPVIEVKAACFTEDQLPNVEAVTLEVISYNYDFESLLSDKDRKALEL